MYTFFRERFTRIDTKNLWFIVVLVVLLVGGCGTGDDADAESGKQVLSVEQIQKDEKVISYFSELNMKITSIELEKRKTDKETGYDYVYLKIVAENDEAKLEGEYEIVSCYYDVGGWLVESIQYEGVREYSPKEDYDYSSLVNETYMEVYGEKADEMEILSVETISSSEYKINAVIYEYGEISDYIWELYFNVVFDVETGKWNCYDIVEYKSALLKDAKNLVLGQQIDGKTYTLYISIKNGDLSVNKLCIGQEEMDIISVTYKKHPSSLRYGWLVNYYVEGDYVRYGDYLWFYVERDGLDIQP